MKKLNQGIWAKKNKKVGYVILNFSNETKNDFKKYFKSVISEEYYFCAEIGGKKKRGLVLDKMHITLFYGIDDEKFDNDKINSIKICDIVLGSLELFYIEEFSCNALVLKVDDKNKKLKNTYNDLSNLDVIEEKINKFPFNPHITIAYVKNDFKIKRKEYFKGKKLKVFDVKYKIKN